MKVEIKLFGSFRRFGNRAVLELPFQGSCQVSDLRQAFLVWLNKNHPETRHEDLLKVSAFADEQSVLNENQLVVDSAQYAVLPPVCGG